MSTEATGTIHTLRAAPETCYWGYIDRDQPPVLEVRAGDLIDVEAVTHHAGDAPDLLMDDGVRAIWAGIAEADRGPGVHILTGPIAVAGARAGDTVAVRIHEMRPRLPYGSNCAANWGLLYDVFGKERITIYGLDDAGSAFSAIARPQFGFDFAVRPLYDLPGVISPVDASVREPFSRPVAVPVRPHFGVMGVAPQEPGRHSSIPPGVFGGNVDNWRIGPGSVMRYPVFVEGAGLYVGDPHFAQGDGEICGTAIEASLDARIEIWVESGAPITAPVLETDTHWYTHGFGDDLDAAMRMAAEQMLDLLQQRFGLTRDDAYSLASVAIDLGVTQVVDGKLGCHAGIAKSILL
ncbi:MAG TPA: acetamidase/formamidase family protein [Acidimicrobiales bacterium]|jgi:acetamidase/formamidase|nr:acetamidase/formamidase family protein [Acidimicrobiales bacterium]